MAWKVLCQPVSSFQLVNGRQLVEKFKFLPKVEACKDKIDNSCGIYDDMYKSIDLMLMLLSLAHSNLTPRGF